MVIWCQSFREDSKSASEIVTSMLFRSYSFCFRVSGVSGALSLRNGIYCTFAKHLQRLLWWPPGPMGLSDLDGWVVFHIWLLWKLFLLEALCSYGLCRTFNMLTFRCAPAKCFSDHSPHGNGLASTLRVSASLPGRSHSSTLKITHFGFGMCTHAHGLVTSS